MNTTLQEFGKWLNAPSEHGRLEFKEAKNQYDTTKLFKYCVALANEGGGKLILGVTNDAPRKVVGSQTFINPQDIQSKILQKLNFRSDVEELTHPNGRVVIFHIPPRPRGTAYQFERTYLMRSGEELVPMTEDRLRVIFDEYQSRNERLADLMRRMGICEEKGSGIDKVIQSAEVYQLPAPDFRVGERHTTIVLFAHKAFEKMDRKDRIRACYQHCCLRYVMNEHMTNQSLRERFKLPESKSATISQVIAEAVDAKLIKLDDDATGSRRYARYLPFWA